MIRSVKKHQHKKYTLKGIIKMAQTNVQLVTEAAEAVGIEYNGENLKTFAEWKRVGMSVKKGEKASVTVSLWKPVTKEVENKETGKKEMKKTFIKKMCHLFTPDQVQPVKEKAAKKETAATTEKKEVAAPAKKAAKKPATKKVTAKKTAAKKETTSTKNIIAAAREGVQVEAPEVKHREYTSVMDVYHNADLKGSEKIAEFYQVAGFLFHKSDLATAEHHAMARTDINLVVAIVSADYIVKPMQAATDVTGYKVLYTELVQAAYVTEVHETQLELF